MADRTNNYELTYVISGVLNDQKTQQTIDKFSSYIKDHDGDLEEVDQWGSQRLAYRIDGKRSGFYVTTYFEAAGTLIQPLERQLQLDDNILSYLTLRMDAKMRRHYRRQQQLEDERVAAEAVAEEEEDEEES